VSRTLTEVDFNRTSLPRDAMHKRGLCRHAVSLCLSVCLSVCLSRSRIVSKLINTSFWFLGVKRHSNIPTETPLTGASNAGAVGGNRDSELISGLTACVNAATGRCCKRGRRWTTATVSQVMIVSGGVDCRRRRRNVYDKKPQRYAKDHRTAHFTARSDQSIDYVTNNKRLYSTFCTVEANY